MIEELKPFTCRLLPEELTPLNDLALDVRWTWNHGTDHLWRMMDPQNWEITQNPWFMLQSISQEKLEQVIADPQFRQELERIIKVHKDYLDKPGWCSQSSSRKLPGTVAYFSMEFGLGEAIPLYAGGLGMLAGDFLKTASDLDVPLLGIGLLYQHGYFRQILDVDGRQISANPPNEPTGLPIQPVTDPQGGWLKVPLELPGRTLSLRAWKVKVGRVTLYLLDSNDLINNPADRSIISKLYDDQPEFRLKQEMILGIGGWKLLEMLGIHPEVCHFNEGHAAFVVLERARSFMQKTGSSFSVALWATRAGNAFTTHTAVAAGFDSFSCDLIERYFREYAASLGISIHELLALGRKDPGDSTQPFNMAILAMRGSTAVNGVSRLHGRVSRQLFQPLFPKWPQAEVPVDHITNGVHMPSWDSQMADEVWMRNAGKACWSGDIDHIPEAVRRATYGEFWELRKAAREELVGNVRRRLEYQLRQIAAAPEVIRRAKTCLDPNALTVGFARRFASYKRPNLLLHNTGRFLRILLDTKRPIQFVIAGKAHPQDEEGRYLVQQMVKFTRRLDVDQRMVFLQDYDIELAQEIVQGVDLWINTPRRPWEACGTSGMKVLVNGGLNLSVLDGWWAEAYHPGLGWSIGDGLEHDPSWDGVEAGQLYDLLENQILPEFYTRNDAGIPEKWVNRIRRSMCELAIQFSSNRMLCEYTDKVYRPALARFQRRAEKEARLAQELATWHKSIQQFWNNIRFGNSRLVKQNNNWLVECEVYPGGISPRSFTLEVFADAVEGFKQIQETMRFSHEMPYPEPCILFKGTVPASRPADHYSLRLIPAHTEAIIPLEDNHILWKHPL